jgi:hypothetical protein
MPDPDDPPHHQRVNVQAQSPNAPLNRARMLEWIAFHRMVGFGAFHLYDHNSDPALIEAMRCV